MINLQRQIDYIDDEIGKYELAYNISLKNVNRGDKSAIPVLELVKSVLDNLKSIKISLEILKHIDQ